MIDLDKMAKEHEKLFPNATLESQLWKLEEEISELQEVNIDEQIKEVADVIIVCAGLSRWFPKTAYFMAQYFVNEIQKGDITYEDVENEINRKWQINLKRKWVWNGKTYHHKGKDGNE